MRSAVGNLWQIKIKSEKLIFETILSISTKCIEHLQPAAISLAGCMCFLHLLLNSQLSLVIFCLFERISSFA